MLTCLAIWNVIVCLIYGVDKILAIKDAHRISEKTLILCAFIFGGIGAFAGMMLFRHKTAKTKFKILVPFACIFNAVLLGLISGGNVNIDEIMEIFKNF
ncbi:MAG: DUF1294 domain-containing protein [Clostridia bacterium]|nr:DUF1294 domain-containing protein [Clostridia bacterium]